MFCCWCCEKRLGEKRQACRDQEAALEALRDEIAAGRFREDLFHRLNVVPVRVPGLAERREDIPELINYFVERISEATGLPRRRLGEDSESNSDSNPRTLA